MKPQSPSKRIVEQRIRNRIIEVLDRIVSFGEASGLTDLNELLNEWEDWVGIEHPIRREDSAEPVYTSAECDAVSAVDRAWERFCDATPQTITDAGAATRLPEWDSLVTAATIAASVLNQRGRMSEEHEE